MAGYRLTTTEKQILRYIEFRPQLSAQEIALALGRRTHTVAYALRKLRSANLIRLRPLIDHYTLGLSESAVFFSISSVSKAERNAFVSQLAADSQVIWCGAFAGEYQYAAVALHRSLRDLQEFIDRAISKASRADIRQVIVPRIAQALYERKYLAISKSAPLEFVNGSTNTTVSLDQTDSAILYHLGNQPIISLRESARFLKMPFSTFDRRLKSLENRRVILGYCYEFDCQDLGLHVYKILVNLRRSGSKSRKRIFDFCRFHPQIINCFATLGHWDIEIRCEVESEEKLMQTTDDLLEICGEEIASFKTLTYLKQVKNKYSISMQVTNGLTEN